jgi:hypothetical protein
MLLKIFLKLNKKVIKLCNKSSSTYLSLFFLKVSGMLPPKPTRKIENENFLPAEKYLL